MDSAMDDILLFSSAGDQAWWLAYLCCSTGRRQMLVSIVSDDKISAASLGDNSAIPLMTFLCSENFSPAGDQV
jgi:hypothetical protein